MVIIKKGIKYVLKLPSEILRTSHKRVIVSNLYKNLPRKELDKLSVTSYNRDRSILITYPRYTHAMLKLARDNMAFKINKHNIVYDDDFVTENSDITLQPYTLLTFGGFFVKADWVKEYKQVKDDINSIVSTIMN